VCVHTRPHKRLTVLMPRQFHANLLRDARLDSPRRLASRPFVLRPEVVRAVAPCGRCEIVVADEGTRNALLFYCVRRVVLSTNTPTTALMESVVLDASFAMREFNLICA